MSKILSSIPMAKIGKNGAKLKMSKTAEWELNQKMKVQDSMFRRSYERLGSGSNVREIQGTSQ